ncbi:MAG: alpha/beta hydrolase [Myxococcota bacterium]
MVRWIIETIAWMVQARRIIGYGLLHPPRSAFEVPPRLRGRVEKTYDLRGWATVTLAPEAPEAGAHLIFVHGGGYSLQGGSHHWWVVEQLMQRTSRRISWVEYPLAPEHRYRDAHAVVESAFEVLMEAHPQEQVSVIADSAGAGMVLALTQKLRDQGRRLPDKLVLLSPWVDISLTNPEVSDMLGRDVLSNLGALRKIGQIFADDLSVKSPLVSPVYGEMDSLPEIALYAGTSEAFLPDIRRLQRHLAEAEVKHRYREFEGMQHTWFMFPLPERNQLMQDVADFLRQP